MPRPSAARVIYAGLLAWCSIGVPLRAGTGATPIDERAITLTLHVAPAPLGHDTTGDGSAARPYASLRRALAVAQPRKIAGTGVKVLLAPGVYREGTPTDNWAVAFNFGLTQSTPAPLVIEGAGWDPAAPRNTGNVIISGSEDWSGNWTRNPDGTWSRDWPYAFGVPANNFPFGVSDALIRRELVHVDGQTYYQINPPNYTNRSGVVGSATEGDPGNPTNVNGGRLTSAEGSFWVTDAVLSGTTVATMGRITIRPPTGAPADFDLNRPGRLVEVTTKRSLLQIWLGTQSATPTNVVLRNLTFQHAGGQSCALIQHQNHLLIEDCRFVKNKRSGLTVNPGRHVTLRRVEVSENGENGAGITSVQNGLLVECSFNRNSRQAEIVGLTGWSTCGIKFYTTSGDNLALTALRCEARDNRSTGFWWDTGNVDCEMFDCLSVNNSANGTFIEANNSTGNNYESVGAGRTGIAGIPNLGARPTVTVRRSVIAGNRAALGTEAYRANKGRGVFFSENENAVIEDCVIVDNDLQIATYDNTRGENRNFTFRRNLIAAQTAAQRLYCVGSTWDSAETLTVRNSASQVVATFKGGWYAFFDGLSGTTNDNLYFAASPTPFLTRAQRWGTDKWATQPANTTPALDLAGWRAAHATNAANAFPDKAVDSRSRLFAAPYAGQPLVVIDAARSTLLTTAGPADAFTVHRVGLDWSAPLTVSYRTTGTAEAGTDFAPLSGTLTIPAGARSAAVRVTPLARSDRPSPRTLRLHLVEGADRYLITGDSTAETAFAPARIGASGLTNLSVRTTLGADEVLTVGLALTGGPKSLLLRASGPSLAGFGVTAFMADPALTVYSGSSLVAANDNWIGEPRVVAITPALGAFPLSSSGSLDAALLRSFAGNHTALISGRTGGNVLFEAYDAAADTVARLSNLSALGRVRTDPLIAGFTVSGDSAKRLLIRGAGPSLAGLGVFNPLPDPRLEVFDSAGRRLADNDNHEASLTAIFASVGAFAFATASADSALVLSVPPGSYTAQVSGVAGATGPALVEVYELP
ncbi:MAG: right-handed parallel beta-helix repeat-containing protein [Verrucomicrobia bacterium]|nr:right-handed parallel beta-helix repeat-containing protein [Verrucomicrobiota bacterium]